MLRIFGSNLRLKCQIEADNSRKVKCKPATAHLLTEARRIDVAFHPIELPCTLNLALEKRRRLRRKRETAISIY